MNKTLKYIFSIFLFAFFSCSGDKDTPDAYGTFEATEITISSQGTGRILWMNIEEGDKVDSGKLVGVIDTTDLMLRKSQAREQQLATAARREDLSAQIAVQEQSRENIMIDQARLEKLYKDGAATKKQLDDVNASLKMIDKQVASIRSQFVSLGAQVSTFDKQVAQLDKSIKDAEIINPVTGTILAKYAEPGEIATFGKPLYRVADLREMILRVYISGSQLSRVKTGQEVEVRFDNGKNSLSRTTGVVSWISPTAEFTPKTIQTRDERVNLVYAVKVRVKNDGSLKIGMPGEIRLIEKV